MINRKIEGEKKKMKETVLVMRSTLIAKHNVDCLNISNKAKKFVTVII